QGLFVASMRDSTNPRPPNAVINAEIEVGLKGESPGMPVSWKPASAWPPVPISACASCPPKTWPSRALTMAKSSPTPKQIEYTRKSALIGPHSVHGSLNCPPDSRSSRNLFETKEHQDSRLRTYNFGVGL